MKKEAPNKPKIIIAVPCNDTMKAKTCLSLVNALRNVDFDYDMVMRQGCDIIGSRTGLVRMAKDMPNATHILFLDHDMFLNPVGNPFTGKMESPITRLLKADKDIVGAPYNFRSLPKRSTATPVSDMSDKKGLYRCEALGTGFLLIKLSVFDTIEKPWFNFGRNSDAELVYGEDTWFCRQAIKAGLEVWADGSLNIGHLGEYEF